LCGTFGEDDFCCQEFGPLSCPSNCGP
jgi:hypothetical protein